MTYTVSEAASKLGVTAEALRYWDNLSYFEADRSPGGWRKYTDEDLEQLKSVKTASCPDKVKSILEKISADTGWGPYEIARKSGLSYKTIYGILNGPRLRHDESTVRKVYGLLKKVKK